MRFVQTTSDERLFVRLDRSPSKVGFDAVPTIDYELDIGPPPCLYPHGSERSTRWGAAMGLMPVSSLHDLIQSYGLCALFSFIMLESMGVPMPGETMLIVAGLYAGSTHRIGVIPLVATATAAAVFGDNIGYLLGWAIGIDALRKYGKYIRLNDRRIKIGRYLFQQQGGKSSSSAGLSPFFVHFLHFSREQTA
jgi:hypothetical protein